MLRSAAHSPAEDGRNTSEGRGPAARTPAKPRTISWRIGVRTPQWLVAAMPRRQPKAPPCLQRGAGNPVLAPTPGVSWESKAVFNPAAITLQGKVHLLYRAIGDDDRSALGHATSSSGFSFDRSGDLPAYVARADFEGHAHTIRAPPQAVPAHDSPYVSGGGGWGGVEDPRLTRIGERIFMTYVAYDGWRPPRVALSSIAVADFAAGRWDWSPPVLISGPGVVNKNAVLFPGRVGGRYVVMHRIYPNILIDYVDDLDFDGCTKWLQGHHSIAPNPEGWDSHKLGAGAPPIETPDGWLLIYQGIGKHDRGRYKIGAMLLDKDHPERVIARPLEPILEPETWYENQGWKAGVAYPCGAVVHDGQLIVYYGGADTYVCAASTPFEPFMRALRGGRTPRLRNLLWGRRRRVHAAV